MKNIVVIGSDHVNTLGIIRSLGEAGEKPNAVIECTESRCRTAKSRYIENCIICSHNKEEMVKALLDFKKDGEIYIVKDREEFASALEKKRGIIVIIQQFIVKDEEIGIQGVGFGKDTEPVAAGVIHKIRTAVIGSIGSTTYGRIAPLKNEAVAEAVKKFIQGIGYDGIFDIELLRKGDDYYFIECNFRNGAYGYSFTCAGANLPLIWINRDNTETNIKELTLMNETSDMKHILKQVSPLKWVYQFISSDIHLTANKKDMKPFFERILSK